MRSFTLSELVQPLQGQLIGDDARFESVSTDSRTVQPNQLFVALPGERVDGHEFVPAVAAAGASCALVSAAAGYPLPVLRVDDTLRALGALAALNRQCFEGPLVAVTGSCGKTSVKNMMHAILQRCGETLATEGNFNNEIGVPLSLLRLAPRHRFAVIEMGAARAGDIDYLCKLARPAVSVLLNAMPAHLEGFGSVDGVAHAKGEILSGLGGSGTAVFPSESPYADLWRGLAGSARCLEFGFTDTASVSAEKVARCDDTGSSFTLRSPLGSVEVNLPVPGRHNIANALAAAAAAIAAGAGLDQVVEGLAAVTPQSGRLSSLVAASGARIIDDSYNANPASLKAAIDVLSACEGHRILVMGAMAELGADSKQMHADVGAYAARQQIDELWATGGDTDAAVAAFGDRGRSFASRERLAIALQSQLGSGDVVLVKGSRSAGMETVVAALLAPSHHMTQVGEG
jgi:UDP-N-acetylmuramoyl-tripeptide--D-alanyl-D-alanine ligase